MLTSKDQDSGLFTLPWLPKVSEKVQITAFGMEPLEEQKQNADRMAETQDQPS